MRFPVDPEVTVRPAGVVIRVPAGRPLMPAALEQGFRWPNVCGGRAECGICHVVVLAGDPPPPEEREAKAILAYRGRAAAADPRVRLGCQLRVTGDLEVRKIGVRPELPPTS